MKKITLAVGLLGLSGVVLGAFGAHALESRLEAAGMVATWETAVLYHLVHAVALLACGEGLFGTWHQKRWIALAWVVGVVLFSGSLYLMCLGGPRWLGPVTPFGGLFLIVGWSLVIIEGVRGKDSP